MTLTLHNYFRSSTSTRLRIALNLKGLAYDYEGYSLLEGAHKSPAFLARNPAGLVPVLELGDGTHLTQSLAIIEWLDETHPDPPLLPSAPVLRAQVRALAYMIACDVHPLNNLRVLRHLNETFNASDQARAAWFTKWVTESFDAMETQVRQFAPSACLISDTPTLADICLYAQVWNNRRFDIGLEAWPRIASVFAHLDSLPAFANAAPPLQPDAA